ncbi:MAG: histidinol-phosphatase HisJ family protein [Verrucomicrobiota bacterium]|jgi:histidinol-phosphatase (PHP family)
MQWPADYHIHTPLCRHARGEPAEYAARALAVGLTEIGFSDHSPMRRDDFDNWRMRLDQLDEYVEKVRRTQRSFPALEIKLGLEVDYLPGHEEWIRQLAGRHPWDYFIGSVHYVADGWAVDNPEDIAKWKERDPLEVWSVYFERLGEAAESGLFEIIGHADLPKKFNIRPKEDCTKLYTRFMERAAKSKVAIELNTAGLRKDCREIYPSRAIVELAARHEVPITFGSDAHAPGEVGSDFAAAVELARSAGYTHWRRFALRQRSEARL